MALVRRGEQLSQLIRVFLFGEHAAEQQRQRDDANAVRICARVGSRQAGRRRHADAVVAPQAIAAKVQFLKGGAERVFGNYQASLRRDEQPLGSQHADGGIAIVSAKERHRRQQLP